MREGTLVRRASHEGFTTVELMAALSVLAIGFFSLAGAMGLGLKQVSLGRQRQTATEIANARLEHLRNLDYPKAALSSQPVHSDDASNPDFYVDPGGIFYDVTGAGAQEELIVDASTPGQVLHFEDPVTVGATEMKVYQYVTWVNDPGITGDHDYKRITIVVEFKSPSISGITQFVRASAFVTTGTVVVSGSTSNPTQGWATSPSPTPSPTPSGSCAGDTTAPAGDFTIVSGTGSEMGYTASVSVTLNVKVTDGCAPIRAEFSNDGTSFSTAIEVVTYPQPVAWSVASGDGTKLIWGKFKDGNGNTKTTGPFTIVLDATPPSQPGTLTHTRSCSGNDRTVNLLWGSSTDTHFRGYRVYRSINSGPWTDIGTLSTPSASDTHAKTLDSVSYYVVGYDKAGNESIPTNTNTLSKNQC